MWFGGIAFALLAAGVIWAVATVQSSRALPFETWARHDLMQRFETWARHGLMQRADGMPGLMPAAGMAGALMVAPTAADGARGEVDAALAADARFEPSDIAIAGLGSILASASAAKELAADLRAPPLPDAVVEPGTAHLLPGPHRPVLRPMLVSASPLEPGEATQLRSRP